MKKSTNYKVFIFITGSILLVLLIIFFFLPFGQFRENPHEKILQIPSPVGLRAQPDQEGWKPLFNEIDLDGWEITNFGPQGDVFIRDSMIILDYGEGCTGINWKKDFPKMNYEISLEAMRVGGHDFFCGLTFPVNNEYCTLITGGWGGSVLGISSIDGEDASENFTSRWFHFENQRWYQINIKVDEKTLRCFIDRVELITVPLNGHKFSVRSEVLLSRPVGICSWVTNSALRNIKFREIK